MQQLVVASYNSSAQSARKYALWFLVLPSAAGSLTGFVSVPFTESFSRIALPLLIVWNSLGWLVVSRRLAVKLTGAMSGALAFAMLLWYAAQDVERTYSWIRFLLFFLATAQALILWTLNTDRSLRRLLLAQQVAVWAVLQMSIYFLHLGAGATTASLGLGAMSARLLFWPPLAIVSLLGLAALTSWSRSIVILVFCGLAMFGNGLFDLWGQYNVTWAILLGLSLWLVSAAGLAYYLWLSSRTPRPD